MPRKKESTVTIELDPAKPRRLSASQKSQLSALAKTPDSKIDHSDIPRFPESFWKDAVRGGLYRPVKRQISVRIDADILAWLKSKGAGYHSRLNEILRAQMLNETKSGT